jgi:hypothetical protein
MVELTESDIAMLTDTNFATFVTVNPDGSPEGRVKHRNCAANPRVAITVMRNGDAYDWISITGTVVGFETGAHAEAHIDELSHRYDGHGYSYTPGQVREILKIRPKRIIRYKD